MVFRTGHYEIVAREGFPFILPPFLLAFLLWCFDYNWPSLLFLFISVAIACFFRNPERTIEETEGSVVSPADGRVVMVVEDAVAPLLGGSGLRRISIFMSIFDVHVNRSPISGCVTKVAHVPGRFLDARNDDASEVNEHNSMVLETRHGNVEVVQIAGKIARRIACWVSPGDAVRQGQRFGLIRFGSRLDVYMPNHFDPEVAVGDRVTAGVSLIASAPSGKVDDARNP